jgi:ubiquinone/menaquinone biosynthesis C-methylase UbiE
MHNGTNSLLFVNSYGGLMNDERTRVCPVELANSLDSKIRRWIQNPRKILTPYVKEGMTVLDFGCGPGFFSIELAQMVGREGRVIAADLQEGMLQKLNNKIQGTELQQRITLTKCDTDSINVNGKIDFGMAFFVVHEVPDKERLFAQLKPLLKEQAQFLIVEPKFFHVSKEQFALTLTFAETAGFKIIAGPGLPFCWSALLSN